MRDSGMKRVLRLRDGDSERGSGIQRGRDWIGRGTEKRQEIECYAQALGVVDVGSLSVELSWRIWVRSGRPSCRALQGQNHGVRRGYRGFREVRQSA